MAKTSKIFFLLLLFTPSFWGNELFSQAQAKVKKTVRAEFLLPRAISNMAFKRVFSGVYNVNLALNFGVNNFNTAVYYNLMQNQIFPKYQSDPHSLQTVHTAGLRFAYDIYPSKEKMASSTGNYIMVSPFIAGGYNLVDYSRLICKTQQISGKHTQTYNISLGANFNLMFSKYDGAGFTVGYNFLNHEFNPYNLCLNEYFNFEPGDEKGLSQYILFGLNVHFDLGKRDQDSE